MAIRRSRPVATVCALAVGAVVALGGGPAARAASPADVEKALARGKEYIYSQYAIAHGNWEKSQKRLPDKKNGQDTTDGQWGGLTALAVFALLASGENPQEERIAKGIEFL